MGGSRLVSSLAIAAVIAVFGVGTWFLVRPKHEARHGRRHGPQVRAGASSGVQQEEADEDDEADDLPAVGGLEQAQAGGPRVLAQVDMSGPPKDAAFEKMPAVQEVPPNATPPENAPALPGPPADGIPPKEEDGPPK